MKLKNTKLRQGDEVIVVSGREKGKRGNIKKIVGDKCIVNDLILQKNIQDLIRNWALQVE